MAKYVCILGGVFSGSGKGICTASIGFLLRMRGFEVQIIKADPYWNPNCGTMNPDQHGEVMVLDDGGEVDLDLGNYERLAGINASKDNICTSGTIFKELIEEHENGKYLGQTLQIGIHVVEKFIDRLKKLGEKADIVICEVGGTVGDAEGFAFVEAIRQLKQQEGPNCLVGMVAPVLWVKTIKEFKTKPLQNSVKSLQSFGIQPDMLFCRSDEGVPNKILDKVSKFTNVPRAAVFDAPDVPSIYQVPIEFYNRHVDDFLVDMLRLKRTSCRIHKLKDLVEKSLSEDLIPINIGIVGKYENCDESYISIKESLFHAGLANNSKVQIRWIDATDIENCKDSRSISKYFNEIDGIIIPGGFGERAILGKIKTIQYAREKKIPILGLCLGLQCMAIEFARNVLGLKDANSIEFDKNTLNPVIHYVEGQEGLKKKSGTMRLGAYDCELTKDSLVFSLYKKKMISERHRHRYEVNPAYLERYSEKGFNISGINPGSNLVEVMELDKDKHPFYLGMQAHPEFKSKLMLPSPPFLGLISAAIEFKNKDSR